MLTNLFNRIKYWVIFFGALVPTRLLFHWILPPVLRFFWHNGSFLHLAQDDRPVYEHVKLLAEDMPYGKHSREVMDVLVPDYDRKNIGNNGETYGDYLIAIGASLFDLLTCYPRAIYRFWGRYLFNAHYTRFPTLKQYYQSNNANTNFAVVFVHGGGFVANDVKIQHHQLTAFVRSGNIVFAPNYPHAPEDPFPKALTSLLKLLAFLKRNDIDRIVLIGESAGGALVTCVAGLLQNPKALKEFATRVLHTYDPLDGIDYSCLEYPKINGVSCWYGMLDRFSWRDKTEMLSWGFRFTFENYVEATPFPRFLTNVHHLDEVAALDLKQRCDFLTISDMCQNGWVKAFPRLQLISGTVDPIGCQHCHRVAYELLKENVKDAKIDFEEYHAGHAFIGLNPFVLYVLQGKNWRDYALKATKSVQRFVKECYENDY